MSEQNREKRNMKNARLSSLRSWTVCPINAPVTISKLRTKDFGVQWPILGRLSGKQYKICLVTGTFSLEINTLQQ